MSDRNRRRVLAQLGLITLFSVCTSLANAQTATWNTTSGNWTTAALWNCTPGAGICVPNGPDYAAILNSPGNTLTLDTTSNPTIVEVNSADIQGGSTLAMGGATLYQHILTNEVGGTLTGNGVIGTIGNTVGNIGTVTNNGTIQADAGTLNLGGTVIGNFSNPGPSGTATLTGGVWQAGVTGTGVLTLPYFVGINSATLVLQNPGSQFNVNPGVGDGLSLLFSQNDGTLTLSNGASERISGPTTFSTPFLNANSSALNVSSGSSLSIEGNLVNDSTSSVQIQNGSTLSASGSVTNFGTFVTGNAPGDPGNNMVNSGGPFTNNGGTLSLLAYGDRLSVSGDFQNINGGTVTLNTNSGMAPLTNNLSVDTLTNDASSIVQVQNGSYLYVAGNVNNAGQLLTGNATGDVGGSSVYVGGTFTNTGKLSVLPGGNTVYAAGDWMNLNGGTVTLNGGFGQAAGALTNDSASSVQVQNGSALYVNGGVNNSGLFLTGNAVGDVGGNTVSVLGNFTNSGTLSVLGYNDQVYVGNGVVPGVGNLMNVNGGVITLKANTGNLIVYGNLTNDALSAVQVQNGSLLLVGALGAGGNVNNAGQFLTGNAMGDVGGNMVVVTGTFNNSGTLSLLAPGDSLSAGTLNDDGKVTVNSGASLTDGQAFVGVDAGSVGNVLINGASWTTTGSLDIGVGGNGTVTIQDNGQLAAGSILIGPDGILVDDPSTVDVNGDFTLDPGGIVQLDVAGATPDLVSRLNISGFGSFQGTIDINFIDGFAPKAGEFFDLIDALGGGDFSQANIEVSGLGPGFQYGDDFSSGDFTLVAADNATPTPEPGFWWPVAFASIVLSFAAVRKNLS